MNQSRSPLLVFAGIKILFVDSHCIVLDKPAGLLVHPVFHKDKKTGTWVRHGRTVPGGHEEEKTLTDLLVERYPEIAAVGDSPATRPGIVHRLDRDTSGVMVVARTQEAFIYLKHQFAQRHVSKIYLAIAAGVFKTTTGVIDRPISIINGTVKRTVHAGKMSREAVTRYQVVRQMSQCALVEVAPVTGRTHQIRLHLASIGHPIIGDELYGKKTNKKRGQLDADTFPSVRLFLHAHSLELALPGSAARMRFVADAPSEFASFLNAHP